MKKKKSLSRKTVKRPEKHVIKRRGHVEKFDERKVYASAYASCLAAHVPEKKCEQVAESVCNTICTWVSEQKVVTAHMLYEQTVKALRKHNKHAAFMYETHMDIS